MKEEPLIVLGISSSKLVLPRMMDKMKRMECSKSVVGLMIPTGDFFNLDGTTIYLSMATIFLAQVFHIDLTVWKQLIIVFLLMLTSKGAGLIMFSSTLLTLNIIPTEGLALLIGVDCFMLGAWAIVNLIENGIIAIVMSKSKKEFDQSKYDEVIYGKTNLAS